MASIILRHKSRHLNLKCHHTLFNLSHLYSSSSSSNNDNDGNHQQQSSNPTQIDEIPNPSNSDFSYLMGDTFRENMQKLKEIKVNNDANFFLTNYMENLPTNKSMANTNTKTRRVIGRSLELGNELEESRPESLSKFKEIEVEKETEKSATEMGGDWNFDELRKCIESIRLKLKDDPSRK